jgi:replication factor C subunit 3/5
MFLVDKYYQDTNYITYHQSIIDKIIDSFDAHNHIYNNINKIITMPKNEFAKIINDLEYNIWRYSNFQHLIVYGPTESCKEYLVNKLLKQIYGSKNIELKDVEYIVSGYSNTKTKIIIKQSRYHIIIEPNSNGFDKYLIQEIIQNYAKSELLNIIKYRQLFKIVIINKIDNLSYYAQASLRRTMEKYSNTCKFILISDQLSKIIEPIRSRCIIIRIPLPNKLQILESILYICYNEKIKISNKKIFEIINKSNNKINHAIWLLEMYKYNIEYNNNWEIIINNIVNIILNFNKKNILNITYNECITKVDYKLQNNNYKLLYNSIKKIREYFYILFITNISTQLIIRKIMIKLLENIKYINDLKLKYNIINITSIFEQRLSLGTRHIIHIEAYIIRLIYLFYNNDNGYDYNYNLDVLEI